MTAKKKTDPDVPENEPLKDADGNAIDPEVGGVTPPDPDAPTTLPPPGEPEELDDSKPITMADVASLQGIGLAPDASTVREVGAGDVPFISAGMASDLEQQGWTIDPATGKKITKE